MGPRSFERGERRRAQAQAQAKLQWGHVHSNVERQSPALPDGLPDPAASMGPRSFERGEQYLAAYVEKHGPASMGPRSFERGESMNNITIEISVSECFNGATFIRTWRGVLCGKEPKSSSASMGPRSFERGELPVVRVE